MNDVMTSHGIQARNAQMENLYRDGATMAEIGEQFTLTRQRVKQILDRRGLSKDQGGAAIRRKSLELEKRKALAQKRAAKKQEMIKWCEDHLGCSLQEAEAINNHVPIQRRGSKRNAPASILDRYLGTRDQCRHKGQRHYLTFPEWYAAWVASGHWDNGPEKGWALVRVDPSQGWSSDNAQVVRMGIWRVAAAQKERQKK